MPLFTYAKETKYRLRNKKNHFIDFFYLTSSLGNHQLLSQIRSTQREEQKKRQLLPPLFTLIKLF